MIGWNSAIGTENVDQSNDQVMDVGHNIAQLFQGSGNTDWRLCGDSRSQNKTKL